MLQLLNQCGITRLFFILTALTFWIAKPVYADVSINSENVQGFFQFLELLEKAGQIQESGIKTYEGTIHTGCGVITSTSYCQVDSTVYINTSEIGQYVDSYGENAFYIIVGHEWGHHLLSQLNYVGPAIGEELASDCISGYVFGLFNKANDWEVSKDELVRIVLQTISAGDSSAYVASHGIGEQRTSYIYRGLNAAQSEENIGICLR